MCVHIHISYIYIYTYILYVLLSHTFSNSARVPRFRVWCHRAMALNENSSEVQGYCSGTLAPGQRETPGVSLATGVPQ